MKADAAAPTMKRIEPAGRGDGSGKRLSVCGEESS